jgi:hypothetical protein
LVLPIKIAPGLEQAIYHGSGCVRGVFEGGTRGGGRQSRHVDIVFDSERHAVQWERAGVWQSFKPLRLRQHGVVGKPVDPGVVVVARGGSREHVACELRRRQSAGAQARQDFGQREGIGDGHRAFIA